MVNTRDGKPNGRNTFMVGLRLRDECWPTLKRLADNKGMTIGDYVKDRIIYLINKADSVNTVNQNDSDTVNKPTNAELQDMIHKIEQGTPPTHPPFVSRNGVPFYNPEIHTSGDTVRMLNPNTKEVKVVTL